MARFNIRSLAGLWGGNLGNDENGGSFLDMFNHPTQGVPSVNVAASVAAIEGNPAAASAIVTELLKQPGVVDIPGVVAALEAVVAASNPFNAAAFNVAIAALETALGAATASGPAVGATAPSGWGGWGTRLRDHLRNVRAQPGHVGGRR